MSDQVSRQNLMKAFVHSPNLDEISKLDTESEKAITKVKAKARSFEADTYTEFEKRRGRKEGKIRVTVDLSQESHRQFKMLAAELETDMNALLNWMVDKFIDSKNR